jgi:hypothetical protein
VRDFLVLPSVAITVIITANIIIILPATTITTTITKKQELQ